jgi:short-subunit dehydrogenase
MQNALLLASGPMEFVHKLQGHVMGAWDLTCANPWLFVPMTLALVTVVSFGTYFVPWLLEFWNMPQNLKKKYDASWALVTGGSSGIGLAIVRRLAADGLNVVIAAYADANMDSSRETLPAEFPDVEFRFVAVNLAVGNEQLYLEPLEKATSDIDVQVVFSNAGYIKTGLFDGSTLGSQLANLHCNATSSAAVAHLFLRRLRQSGKRGCVCFTSSPAMLTPCPLSAMYGATKAFLTELAVSIAPEVTEFGIDVAVVHPSPVLTNFYTGTDPIGALLFFKSTATGPDTIALSALSGIGRRVVIEQGYYGAMMRCVLKLIDSCLMAEIVKGQASGMADYRRLRDASNQAEELEAKKGK